MVATRADNPKCVSAHAAFETDRTPVPLTSLCVCCALHGCAVDGIFLGTFVVERWTLPRRGHLLPHLRAFSREFGHVLPGMAGATQPAALEGSPHWQVLHTP